MAVLKGWKTRIISISVFVLGVADICRDIDVRGFLVGIGVPGDKVGVVMVALAIVFGCLRELTTTPPGTKDTP